MNSWKFRLQEILTQNVFLFLGDCGLTLRPLDVTGQAVHDEEGPQPEGRSRDPTQRQR